MHLPFLGADASVYASFQPFESQQLFLARVSVAQRERYRLYAAIGECDAEASGALWYRAACSLELPVTGDWVAAREVGPEQAIVEHVLPRRSLFSRRAAGRREEEQPIAANIDVVFLVCGLDGDFNLRRLERYLTLAAESGAQPVIVLNKSDLCADLTAAEDAARSVAGAAAVVTASTQSADGLGGLRDFLAPGRTVALLGSSGVGKSSIVNGLLGDDLLRTGAVRAWDQRGRHTTTHRELVPVPGGGALIDTPGMRELQLWASEESVDCAFPEIAALAESCKFRDCTHTGEPGCAVTPAVTEGNLPADRWESYRKLVGEARRHEALSEPLAALEQKRKLKQLHRAQRAYSKLKR